MRIVVFDDGTLCSMNFDAWLTSNGWNCTVTDTIQDIESIKAVENPTVFIVKEG